MIAAISYKKVIASQIVEGSVDSVLYENFIYQMLVNIRKEQRVEKDIVLLMDNAVIHRHSAVLETARKFRVNVLFNAEYSPWLNPVEQLFGFLKKELRDKDISIK